MKILNFLFMLLFKSDKYLHKTSKYLPSNWIDNKGNNLYHYAARKHDSSIFELAKNNKADINHQNIKGVKPIHTFIDSCFVYNISSNKKWIKEDEQIEVNVEFNEQLLNDFIKEGADINAFINDPEKNGQWGKNVALFNRKNTQGSPLELLIGLYWEHIRVCDYEKTYDNYLKIYNILSNNNANINKIKEMESIVLNEHISDAMQTSSSIIVSQYFIRYLYGDSDFYPLKPIFQDKNLDFFLEDDSKNTILHGLCGRISARYHTLTQERIEEVFSMIVNNQNFKPEALDVQNSFKLTPIKLLKADSAITGALFKSVMMKNNLEKIIPIKQDEKKEKRKKL